MKLASARKLRLTWQELTLISLAVLAVSLAFLLAPPSPGAWAAYQSPISPPSAVSPLPTQPPVASPKAVVGTLAPAPTPRPVSTPQMAGGNSTAMLVVGGIVLAGLVVGAVVLLVRGQPPDEPQEKE